MRGALWRAALLRPGADLQRSPGLSGPGCRAAGDGGPGLKRLLSAAVLGFCVWGGVFGTLWAGDTPEAPDAPVTSAAPVDEPETPQATASYSLGFQLGSDLAALKRLGRVPDLEAVLKGLSDAMAGVAPAVGAQEMGTALEELRRNGAPQEGPAHAASPDEKTTQAFNALHAGQEGVVTLPSGLQYKVIRAGTGRQPEYDDVLTINYKAAFPDGVQVDSSYEGGGPATLRLSEVEVPGLKQALALMREGAKWELYVPPALAFSEFSTLRDRAMIYEVELLAVTPAEADPTPVRGGD